MKYPGATPEFRILIRTDGTQALQVRYVNISVGYTSKWEDVPLVCEKPAEITC